MPRWILSLTTTVIFSRYFARLSRAIGSAIAQPLFPSSFRSSFIAIIASASSLRTAAFCSRKSRIAVSGFPIRPVALITGVIFHAISLVPMCFPISPCFIINSERPARGAALMAAKPCFTNIRFSPVSCIKSASSESATSCNSRFSFSPYILCAC